MNSVALTVSQSPVAAVAAASPAAPAAAFVPFTLRSSVRGGGAVGSRA